MVIDPNAPISRADLAKHLTNEDLKSGIKRGKKKERIDPVTGAVVNDTGRASSGPSANVVENGSGHLSSELRAEAASGPQPGVEYRASNTYLSPDPAKAVKRRGNLLSQTVT